MDFAFSEDQVLLRDSVRKALGALPLAQARQGGAEAAVARGAWEQAAALGWPALLVPEAAGGLGLGQVEAVILGEEMGRALFPASFRDSAVLLPSLLARLPAPEAQDFYQALGDGRMQLALACLEPGADWSAASACRLEGRRLDGKKILVEHAAAATHFLVLLQRPGGAVLALLAADAPGVEIQARSPLDITCSLADLVFQDAEVMYQAELAAQEGAGALFEAARLFNCAELVGVAQAALDMSLSHARERRQFGQAIGSFQAIKHRLADAFVRLENARSGTYYAAMALQDGMPDARFALDAAQALCGEMAVRVTSDAIQVHGGMGFTWECDLHLYFKRARRLSAFCGGARQAHQRIAAGLA